MDEIERLEQAIEDAEIKKKEFVKQHPTGEGDSELRSKLYIDVEKARKALRAYKLRHPELLDNKQ